MSYTLLGSLPGKGSLVRSKRQRKSGGSKNVFSIGISPDLYHDNSVVISSTLVKFGGERHNRDNAYVFTKRVQAEKAWAWFVLRYS